jgi:hypothetical protein
VKLADIRLAAGELPDAEGIVGPPGRRVGLNQVMEVIRDRETRGAIPIGFLTTQSVDDAARGIGQDLRRSREWQIVHCVGCAR